MASAALLTPRPLILNNPALALGLGMAGTAMLVTSTVYQTYAAAWIIGVPALLFLLVAGTAVERLVLVILLALSLLAGSTMMEFGLRQVIFISMFMLFARYLVVRPMPAAIIFLAGFFASAAVNGEFTALFMLAPTFLLLLRALEIRHPMVGGLQPANAAGGWKAGLLAAISFVFPLVGSGSRTAFFVWIAYFLRQITVPMLILGVIGFAVLAYLPGVMMVDKLMSSLSELTTPIPEDGIGFSMRALEGLIFLSWFDTATVRELLTGSREIIYLPGVLLGKDPDPPFIPHNQLFGLLFQFGIIGLAALAWYLRDLWRHQRGFPPGRYLFFMLLVPGFITSGGFITTDYAILAAAVNGLVHLHGAGRSK